MTPSMCRSWGTFPDLVQNVSFQSNKPFNILNSFSILTKNHKSNLFIYQDLKEIRDLKYDMYTIQNKVEGKLQ